MSELPKSINDAFDELEALREAELQRNIDAMVELEVRLRLAEREQAALRRSQLSAKQQSEIIRARGVEFYWTLPW